MNFDFNEFEKAEAKEFGDFERLELGGHEVVIVDAREHNSEKTGKISLKVSVDIAKGDKQEGFFKKQYEDAKKSAKEGEEVKWSTGGTKYISLEKDQLPYFKGFITALENSNKGFKFDTKGKWEQLKNLHIAAQFGLEEYDNGTDIKVATKLNRFRSLDKLKEIDIPAVKVLNDDKKTFSYIAYEDYVPRKSNEVKAEESDLVELKDEDLPF